MSGKLDQSLDEILSTRRKNAKAARGSKRVARGGAKAAGGIQKTAKATAKPVINTVVPTGPASKGEGKIIVSNLPSDVNETMIKEYFSKTAGAIKKVQITYGPNGQSRGIALIIFHRAQSATDALQKLNGVLVDNRPLKIEVVLDAAHAPAATPVKALSERVAQPKAAKAKAQAKTATPKAVTTNKTSATTAGGSRGGRRRARGGRPKPKTAEELDAEMVDYFGNGENTNNSAPAATNGAGDVGMDDGIAPFTDFGFTDMVIEGNSSSPGFDDPPSFEDGFSSRMTNFGPYTIPLDTSQLQRVNPIVRMFHTSYERRYNEAMVRQLGSFEGVMRRPPNQVEATALAQHTMGFHNGIAWFCAVGAGFGAYRSYATRKKWKFPMVSAGRLDPDSFLRLTGSRAHMAWHTVRLGCYMTWYWFVLGVVGDVYFGGRAAVRNTLDPRLADYNEIAARAMKDGSYTSKVNQARGEKRDEMWKRKKYGENAVGAGTNSDSTFSGPTAGRSKFGDPDEASPTAGDFQDASPLAAEQPSMLSDDQIRARETTAEISSSNPRPRSQVSNSWQRIDQNRSQAASQSSDDDDDWLGGGDPQSPSRASQSQRPGSAWERLRSQTTSGNTSTSSSNAPSAASGAWGRQSQPTDPSDNFSFSSKEEEKSYAQSEAQKEFDARVERERRGKDFDSSGGGEGRRGWGSWGKN